ncbi:MAG: hypothetical protein SFU98_01950 [Leptospiraceae bacterium]|nr:hypothetical protein [Leptospiraceae bacterium]
MVRNLKNILLFAILLSTFPLFSDPIPKSGFQVKGGIWGLGGSFKSEMESKFQYDKITDGILETGWNTSNKIYALHPIGLDWYKPMGPGSLMLGADFNGFPGVGLTGHKPDNSYNSFFATGIGINNTKLTFTNQDFKVGYLFVFDKLFITPQFLIRRFASDMTYSGYYFGTSTGADGGSIQSTNYSGFLGVNSFYKWTDSGSFFLNLSVASPILGTILTEGKHNSYQALSGIVNFDSGKMNPEYTGQKIQLGYQHNWGDLGLQVGYSSETLNVKYKNVTGTPVFAGSNVAGINVFELLTDRFIYSSAHQTEIKSIFIALNYKFGQ